LPDRYLCSTYNTQNATFLTAWRRIFPVTESCTAIVEILCLVGLLGASDDRSSNVDAPAELAASFCMPSDAGNDSGNVRVTVTDAVAELSTLPLLRPLFVNACWRRSTFAPPADAYQIHQLTAWYGMTMQWLKHWPYDHEVIASTPSCSTFLYNDTGQLARVWRSPSSIIWYQPREVKLCGWEVNAGIAHSTFG